jgi:hypothetical protein
VCAAEGCVVKRKEMAAHVWLLFPNSVIKWGYSSKEAVKMRKKTGGLSKQNASTEGEERF